MIKPLPYEIALKQHVQLIAQAVDTSSGCCVDHVCVCALSVVAAALHLYVFYNSNVSRLLSLFSTPEILFISECCLDILMEEPNKQYQSDDIANFVQHLRTFHDTLRHIVLFVCVERMWLRDTCADNSFRWKWFTIHFSHYVNPVDEGSTTVCGYIK